MLVPLRSKLVLTISWRSGWEMTPVCVDYNFTDTLPQRSVLSCSIRYATSALILLWIFLIVLSMNVVIHDHCLCFFFLPRSHESWASANICCISWHRCVSTVQFCNMMLEPDRDQFRGSIHSNYSSSKHQCTSLLLNGAERCFTWPVVKPSYWYRLRQ